MHHTIMLDGDDDEMASRNTHPYRYIRTTTSAVSPHSRNERTERCDWHYQVICEHTFSVSLPTPSTTSGWTINSRVGLQLIHRLGPVVAVHLSTFSLHSKLERRWVSLGEERSNIGGVLQCFHVRMMPMMNRGRVGRLDEDIDGYIYAKQIHRRSTYFQPGWWRLCRSQSCRRRIRSVIELFRHGESLRPILPEWADTMAHAEHT